MKTRILAAFVGLTLVMPILIWGGYVGAVVLVAVVLGICFDEYSRMAFPDDQKFAFLWMLIAGFSLYATHLYVPAAYKAAAVAAVVMGTMIQVAARPGEPMSGAADRLGRYMLGLGWIAGLFPFLVHLRTFDQGVVWVILGLGISWMADTGAYFAGRFLGKRKLYPRVSPKKTWAGFFGGVVVSTLGVQVFRHFWLTDLTVLDAIVLGVVGSSLSVWGDLSESMLKRSFGIKDSGRIMPGHGGLLDRIDSVLFVAPWVYGYMTIFKGL